jgi:DNA-binding CsgD family transcriptional regulator
VLGLISAGLTNNEIAEATALSINSIKTYIRAAYRKIGAASRSQAVLWAVRNGCVVEPPTGRLVAV